MTALMPGKDFQTHKFEVLLYTYFDGWTGFAYDEYDHPVKFGAVEEALADLQDAFKIWDQQILDGERTPDQLFSPDDFAIRSVATGDQCPIAVSKNVVVLKGKGGKTLTSHVELEKINLTGRFS
jgi:hypothetical protein